MFLSVEEIKLMEYDFFLIKLREEQNRFRRERSCSVILWPTLLSEDKTLSLHDHVAACVYVSTSFKFWIN
jgi:hypothetical protein